MISKRVKERRDGKSSVSDALRYGEGLKIDRETGELLDKSHRTRLGNFGLVDDGVYVDRGVAEMEKIISRAVLEMQSNCDQNERVAADKKLAHFVVSFNQTKPSEAALLDTENSMLAAMDLQGNHFATFLHNDNGHWHLHMFASRIEKEAPHRGNPLWHDRIKRDQVCREIEARHGLDPDNGMHQINELGQLVEIPRAERRSRQEVKSTNVSDRARTVEIYSGEKTFQTWASEIRLGDRLKHAKSWAELHHAAAAYACEIKPKGAGFIVQPVGQAGGIQLSKLGLKNLPARLGAFQESQQVGHAPQASYRPEPAQGSSGKHFESWTDAKRVWREAKTERLNAQRDEHAAQRAQMRSDHKTALVQIRRSASGPSAVAEISVEKMRHAVAMATLTEQFGKERQILRNELAGAAPGNTFRDYLVREAAKGDNVALGLARRYGARQSTVVLCEQEAMRLRIVAEIGGNDWRPAPRLQFSYRVERSGTVVYDFGAGRTLTDSAIARRVQLNDVAAGSQDTVGAALRLAAAKFGSPLKLSGSQEFQRLAVETAVRDRIAVRFTDPALEAYRAALEAQRPTGRALQFLDFSFVTKRQIQIGVNHVLKRNLDQGRPPPEHVLRTKQHRPVQTATGAAGLHDVSDGSVDGQVQPVGVLLPGDVPGSLGAIEKRQSVDVRRTSDGTGGSAESDGQAESDRVSVVDQTRAALIAELRRQGVEVRDVLDGQRMVGKIRQVTEHFVVQGVGRNAVVVHDRDQLSGSYAVGQDAEVTYQQGRGNDRLQGPVVGKNVPER